jgi:hypothetical protein
MKRLGALCILVQLVAPAMADEFDYVDSRGYRHWDHTRGLNLPKHKPRAPASDAPKRAKVPATVRYTVAPRRAPAPLATVAPAPAKKPALVVDPAWFAAAPTYPIHPRLLGPPAWAGELQFRR